MLFHLRCITTLGLLFGTCTVAQSSSNASTSFNSTVTASPSKTLNSSLQDHLHSCNSAWQSYISRKKRAYETVTVSTITLPPVTATKYLGIQTCSSYCGSICYADTKKTTGSTIVTETYENLDYSIETRLTYTQPPPNCTIPPADCRQLWSDYTTAQSSWSNRTPDPNVHTIPPSPITPGCTVGCQRTTCSFGGGDKGIIPTPGVIERYYNSLQVYYFPETRNVSRNMCASTPTQTPVPFPTTDVTSYTPTTTEGFAVVDGKTLYKGNVYISISQMEVRDNCDYTTIMEDVAFPVASSDVQSERGDLGFTSRVYPVNWADFIEPVPYSAYVAALDRTFAVIDPAEVSDHVNYCKTAICDRQVVYPHSFNPWILLPPAVKHLDPEFANCDLRWDLSFFDPPIALTAIPNFLATTASEPLPTPAKPASSVVAMPVQTGDVSYSGPHASRPPASEPTVGAQIPNESACHISTCPSNQGPASGPQGSNNAGSGVIVPAQPLGDKDHPGAPGSPGAPDAPDSPGAPGAPGASQPANPATPARPQITLGPTLIPIASDGHGIVIQSPTTFAPSSSAVIGGTTFHLQSGVLTMISSGEASTLTIGAASQNAIGTVVGLANGDFTIQTTGSSLVFNIQSTLRIGDPAQTVGDVVYSVGNEGVVIKNLRSGEQTSIPMREVEAMASGRVEELEAEEIAALFGVKSTALSGDRAPASTVLSGDQTADSDFQRESSVTGDVSDETQSGGEGATGTEPVATASTAFPSRLGSAGSNSDEGSETSAPSSESTIISKGAAASVSHPRHFGLLSGFILMLYL